MERREFVKVAAGGFVAAACNRGAPDGPQGSGREEASVAASPATSIPTRPLGRTGWNTSILSLGGERLLFEPGRTDEAIALIRRAVELGVNYFDTAPKYGPSREYLGRALEGLRDGVYLASKVNLRDRDGARRQIDESLRLLRTDRLDSIQIHDVRTREDVSEIFGVGGAYRAVKEAQEQGVARFVGVTGHTDPGPLLDCIRREQFDTMLISLNCADPHHLPFAGELLQTAVQHSMGIVAMKVLARGRLFRKGGLLHAPGVTTLEQAIRYALSHPVHTALIGCDNVQQLEQNVDLAKRFEPLHATEMRRLEQLTRPYALKASYFKDWDQMTRIKRLRFRPLFERGEAAAVPEG